MREIKFRAFGPGVIKSENTMIYNVAISEEGNYLNTFMDYTYEENEGYILMQYAGLKDMNGKEIYEGDIILLGNIKHKVVYVDQHNADQYTLNPTTMFYGLELEPSKQDRKDKLLYVEPLQWEYQEYYKVIGNIYENPGLFERKENDGI